MHKGKCPGCGKVRTLYTDYGGPGKPKSLCSKCSGPRIPA